ncbi:MAG: hypothetical protein JW924_03310 [Fusobacteriaceae bacterium]|nr:hypothetical protein [Fusobacteriaceae bacterium]
MDYRKGIPTVTYRLTQNEYGSIEFWRKLANKDDTVDTISMHNSHFDTSWFDIAGYLTDDDGNFLGTELYPELRLAGFSISIGSPEDILERSFDFVGEGSYLLQGNNAYYIYLRKDVASGDLDSAGSVDIVVGAGDYANYPDPVANPDKASETDSVKYLWRVMKIRGTASTKLVADTDYTYNPGTKTLTVSDCQADDIIKVWYTASSYISGQDPFTLNDADKGSIDADAVDLYFYIPASGKPDSTDYLHKIQSATIDVTFDRADYKEIGNDEIILRGVNEYTATVTLNRYLHDLIIEEAMRNVASNYGVIDLDKLVDNLTLILKIYNDDSKSTFRLGYKLTNLSPTEARGATSIDEYESRDITLEGEELIITTNPTELGI